MNTTRLARRLGLDGNPLRRRIDKIAPALAVLLVAVFVAGAPWLSVTAAGWAGRGGTAGQHAGRWWRQVPAVVRWVLDRRRLAAWEAAWATVGPQWTKRFRSRG